MRARVVVGLCGVALLGACDSSEGTPHESPSFVENAMPEGDLTRVHLTSEAVHRLGIETGAVQSGPLPASRSVGGEVIIPPGRTFTVAAPVAGSVHLDAAVRPGARVAVGDVLLRLVPLASADRDTRARAVREVEASRAAFAAAAARLERTRSLAEGRAGSVRAVEEAEAARDIASADLQAARARLRTTTASPLLSDVSMTVRAPESGVVRSLTVGAGQAVAGGTPLMEIVAVDELWVRAPIQSVDLHRLVADADASIEPLGGTGPQRPTVGRFVSGPPTAAAGVVDRYFALDTGASYFAPGERVLVTVPLRDEAIAISVPHGAMVYDANGSEWVYVCDADNVFRRARVQVERRVGNRLVLRPGLEVGTCVVSVGAAEVFGAEFEPGH